MPADPFALDLYCPNCQYSLRGLSGNRCPECGGEFDLSALSRSRVPWYQRRQVGLVKAWWKTCWMAAFRTRDLAISIHAPAPYAEARKFWLFNAILLSLPWCVLAWMVPVELPGTRSLDALRLAGLGGGSSQVPSWLAYNLLIPMQGALCFRPVVAVCTLLSVLLVTGGVTYLFQLMPLPRPLQDRAASLSLFSCGSVIAGSLIMAALCAVIGMLWLAVAPAGYSYLITDTVRALSKMAMPFVGGVALIWWASLVLLYHRMCHATLARTASIAVLLPLLSLAALLLCFVVLPWCIGMLRMMLAFP